MTLSRRIATAQFRGQPSCPFGNLAAGHPVSLSAEGVSSEPSFNNGTTYGSLGERITLHKNLPTFSV